MTKIINKQDMKISFLTMFLITFMVGHLFADTTVPGYKKGLHYYNVLNLPDPAIPSPHINLDVGGRYTVWFDKNSNGSFDAGESITVQGTGTVNQSSGIVSTSQEVRIGRFGYMGTYNLSGGTLSVGDDLKVADWFADGLFNHSGGSAIVGHDLVVGNNGVGTYSLKNSGIVKSKGDTAIGLNGGAKGIFNQSETTKHEINGTLYLGDMSGSHGTYNLSGGSLSESWSQIGNNGTGLFNQTGGSHVITNKFYLGDETGSDGTYNFSNGFLSTGSADIGNDGTGTFNQSGGNYFVKGDLDVGDEKGGSGIYNLSGGNLKVSVNTEVGDMGTGSFKQTAGAHEITNSLVIGDSADSKGTYELSGGSLKAADAQIGNGGTANIKQSGGTNTISNSLIVGNTGNGAYDLSEGTLKATEETIGKGGTGSFVHSGGTNEVSGKLNIGKGSYELKGSSKLISTGYTYIGNNGAGSFVQSGGNSLHKEVIIDNQGIYKLSGGTLDGSGSNSVMRIGETHKGFFEQRGGLNSIDKIILGDRASASGRYDLIAKSDTQSTGISSKIINVGQEGNGIFNQIGGSNSVTQLNVGGFGNSVGGTYNMGGKSLLRSSNIHIGKFGISGTGSFNHKDGVVKVDLLSIFGRGTYTLLGSSSIKAKNEFLGGVGWANFHHEGGTNTIEEILTIGDNFTTTGTYNLRGSSSTLTSGGVKMGVDGKGFFNQEGGIHTVSGSLDVGVVSGGRGTYDISKGTLSVGNTLTIGKQGTGNFIQDGVAPKVTTGTLILGNTSGGKGAYTMKTGSLTAQLATIGSGGEGSIDQTGGTVKVNSLLALGSSTGGKGTYSMEGGSLTAHMVRIGEDGEGSVVQKGGNVKVNSTLTLGSGNGKGEYNLKGGSLITNNLNIGSTGKSGWGKFHQSGQNSEVKVLKNLNISVSSALNEYNLSGGSLKAETINNSGNFNYTGGSLQTFKSFNNSHNFNIFGDAGLPRIVTGDVTNEGIIEMKDTSVIIKGDVINKGTVKTTDTTARFTGKFTNNGIYTSDPSDNYFTDLIIGSDGYLTGGVGDSFFIENDFINNSSMNMDWNTIDSYLGFTTGTDKSHDFYLASADLGSSDAAFQNNFAWGTIEIEADNTLNLFDGNSDAGAALYAKELLGLDILGDTIMNVDTAAGLNIYYDPTLAANSYLLGHNWKLMGGGWLYAGSHPVPEPGTILLLGSGIAILTALRKRYGK